MNAADVMVSNVITVSADAGVRDVAKILMTNGISAVPIVDKHGELVGIISEGDLVRRPEIDTEKNLGPGGLTHLARAVLFLMNLFGLIRAR